MSQRLKCSLLHYKAKKQTKEPILTTKYSFHFTNHVDVKKKKTVRNRDLLSFTNTLVHIKYAQEYFILKKKYLTTKKIKSITLKKKHLIYTNLIKS